MSLNPSSIKSLKDELAEMAAKFAGDFVTAGYTDYSSFRDEIKEMFSSAVTYGIQSKATIASSSLRVARWLMFALEDLVSMP